LFFLQKKKAFSFVVFGNMFTFAAENENVMEVKYYISQASEEDMMPSGFHVCLTSLSPMGVDLRSHFRC
jgi:hypothetical protein